MIAYPVSVYDEAGLILTATRGQEVSRNDFDRAVWAVCGYCRDNGLSDDLGTVDYDEAIELLRHFNGSDDCIIDEPRTRYFELRQFLMSGGDDALYSVAGEAQEEENA